MSKKDWSKIERDITAQEEEERKQLKGDDALNFFFRKIYADANEDQRRAMLKSFHTSGGTVLSTDWSTVSCTDYKEDAKK